MQTLVSSPAFYTSPLSDSAYMNLGIIAYVTHLMNHDKK